MNRPRPFHIFKQSLARRDVWLRMAGMDLRSMYRKSILGPLWSPIHILATSAILGFIFGVVFHNPLSHFLPYLFIGLILWSILSASFISGGMAFITAEGYLKQIPIPRHVFVLRTVAGYLLGQLPGLLLFLTIAPLFLDVNVAPARLAWALGGFTAFAVACMVQSLAFAYLVLRFRDLVQISTVLLQLLMYLTPIIYPISLFRERGMSWLFEWNTFYAIIEVVRGPLLSGAEWGPDPMLWVLVFAHIALFTVLAWFLTRKYDADVALWL